MCRLRYTGHAADRAACHLLGVEITLTENEQTDVARVIEPPKPEPPKKPAKK
jgi:hypothetical protein